MCYDGNARPPVPAGAALAASGTDQLLTAEDGNRFAVYTASPQSAAQAQVVIFPDVRGLHQFYKDLALRFAEQGVAALALDYFGRTAGLTARGDDFDYMPHVAQIRFAQFLLDVRASLSELRKERPHVPTFTLGFCMGGTLSLLAGAEDLGLSGVVSFYSSLSREFDGVGSVLTRAPASKYPVLALFGGADQHIPPESVTAFDAALDTSGVEHSVITYAGAPHSFFDKKATEYADASRDAWARVLTFMRANGAATP